MPLRKYCMQEQRLMGISVVAMLMALFASTVLAEHEADHRYDVRGYVLDAQKNPRSGVPVTILMDDKTIGSGRTDSKGFYSVRLHLHDSDIGRTLKVRAGNAQAEIRMQAKRGDQTTTRFHHVNFVGREFVEGKLSAGSVPTWAYIAAAPVVLWAGVYMTGAMRRRIRKTKSTQRRKNEEKPKS